MNVNALDLNRQENEPMAHWLKLRTSGQKVAASSFGAVPLEVGFYVIEGKDFIWRKRDAVISVWRRLKGESKR
ncbi:unnamed protein product [Dibothriocephalus latus]|uniref:Uncharacterized protein n=1 Tax=Dibothriocephalus latus TaxID=60516 RepID=A0A3P7QQK2_DIBLA|nr:unnamed protein product [Dibothriocephalus latus]